MARTAVRSGNALFTKKAVDARLRRAVKRALAKERRARPHAFTPDTFLDHNRFQHAEGFRQGQAVLRETHVVLTEEELDVKIRVAQENALAGLRIRFPHRFTSLELQAHDFTVCAARESELRTAFDAELAAKCAEAKAAGATEVLEEISAMVANVLKSPHGDSHIPGLCMLGKDLLEEARKVGSSTSQAEFGFSFAANILQALQK